MLLFGAAYYTEYLPAGREDTDFQWMREAGMNTIRIAESTWATYEPTEGAFDFSSVTRVLQKATEHGLKVIVGTPTYAIPPWLAAKYPDVLVTDHQSHRLYGPRQNMDITNPDYLRHAERIIRRLMEAVSGYPCVIGFQLDNETKAYDVCSPRVQKRFVESLRARFQTVEALNAAFGLAYWSNRIGAWEDFPDVRGAINASLSGAFAAFQRSLVTEFLAWQAAIVREYAQPEQFITHNFDFEWRGSSFGVQPEVEHNQAARCLTVAGCDIYHPSQDALTGAEIAFCGDLTRCLKGAPYLVIETEAQGFPQWTPYPGQLRLQAFSHVASGAAGVMYWHWHSLHNALETYWKGVLSHDLQRGAAYEELAAVGADFLRLSPVLAGYRKHSRAAMLVSNPSLSAVDAFRIPTGMPQGGKRYNDVVRRLYDACYRVNLELDVVFEQTDLSGYSLVFAPCLYAVETSLLQRLRDFVERGGHLVAMVKAGFCDENTRVRDCVQPALMADVFGCSYEQFTEPVGVTLEDGAPVSDWMELLRPEGATVLSRYQHPTWERYAAITRNPFGLGQATYVGCLPHPDRLEALVRDEAKLASVTLPDARFPLIIRQGEAGGRRLTFALNYSGERKPAPTFAAGATELLTGRPVSDEACATLAPWGMMIVQDALPKGTS